MTTTAHVGVLCAALLLVTACGGDSGPTTPTTTPPPGASVDACAAVAGQTVNGSTAITNGTACSTANTSVVLLNMRAADGFAVGACSGTIIAPRAVLTAAHCLDEDVRTVRVWLGSGDLIEASAYHYHPDYRSTNTTAVDVGVVLLAEPIGRSPIPLLGRDAIVGETAVVAGWGRDLDNVGATLRAGATTLSAVTPSVLQTQFNTLTGGICAGDSGGPILLMTGGTWAIGGITSAASSTTCNTGTHYYANVRHEPTRSFIRQHVPDAAQR